VDSLTMNDPIAIRWHDWYSKDFVDVLPLKLFLNEGISNEVTHIVMGRDGRRYQAMLLPAGLNGGVWPE
jgi:hypothetical protein